MALSLKTLRARRKSALKWYRLHSVKAKASKARAARYEKKIRERTTGAPAAVRWALQQVGTPEKPAGSNWGPKIEDWIKASGYGFAVPWCQCFANAAAVHGGAPQLRTGYTPFVLRGLGGYKPIPASEARAGDMVFFKWPGVSHDSCDHVGILTKRPAGGTVTAVEGNTSPGTAGSQNDGGGVFLRTRSASLVAGYVRPPYPKV